MTELAEPSPPIGPVDPPSRPVAAFAAHLAVVCAYAVVAVAFSWPLVLHMGTHLLGDPAGDTGVYFWNQWVFRHELLESGRLPYFTDRLFATTGSPANLSLHNYTPFQDLVALPFQPWLGTVVTFNLVFLLMRVGTAYATFLLARAVSGAPWPSWLAGLLFAWSPLMVTRGMAHFSLLAAAPLSLFLLLLMKWTRPRNGWVSVALGACIAWATYSDAYYGIYCLIAGAAALGHAVLAIPARREPLRRSNRIVDAGIVLAAAIAGVIAVSGGTSVSVLGVAVHLRTLYTPMLVLALLLAARLLMRRRLVFVRPDRPGLVCAVRSVVLAGVTATVLLAPLLYAAGVRYAQGRLESSPVYWRSSPRGVDVLALLTPNPNHPFVPSLLRAWLEPATDHYFENVVSLSLVGLILIAVALWKGWRPSRWWALLTVLFGSLALGPFVHIAGVNTAFPGPWALLRFVPVIGLARTPGRFAVMLSLVFAVLAAVALAWLTQRWAARRRAILAVVTAGLLLELMPAPRAMHSASVPAFYRHVALAAGDVRVLHVPFGVRDGTSSVGNFNPRTQFFQTAHAKPLIGGYLSRVSSRRVESVRAQEVLNLLVGISEGRGLDPASSARLGLLAPAFVARERIGFVVLDRISISPDMTDTLRRAMGLMLVEADGPLELYRTAALTP